MRICFFNRSHYPDLGATGQLLTELAKDLVYDYGCRAFWPSRETPTIWPEKSSLAVPSNKGKMFRGWPGYELKGSRSWRQRNQMVRSCTLRER